MTIILIIKGINKSKDIPIDRTM